MTLIVRFHCICDKITKHKTIIGLFATLMLDQTDNHKHNKLTIACITNCIHNERNNTSYVPVIEDNVTQGILSLMKVSSNAAISGCVPLYLHITVRQ